MNKSYLFTGIGAVIVVIILVISLSSSTISVMTLDQILTNKDCVALEKWEEEHIYDENLNLTDEQKKKMMSVGLECVGKAMKNMFGNTDSSGGISEEEEDNTEVLRVFDEIIKTRDCEGMAEWVDTNGNLPKFLSDKQKGSKFRLDSSCRGY